MMELVWRKARFLPDDARIDCELFLDGEWIPFTADPNDVEEHGREIYAALFDVLTKDAEE